MYLFFKRICLDTCCHCDCYLIKLAWVLQLTECMYDVTPALYFSDDVAFGEVASEPPAITAMPRKAAPTTKNRVCLLSNILVAIHSA